MHSIDPESVRKSPLTKQKILDAMLMFLKDSELSQENPTSSN